MKFARSDIGKLCKIQYRKTIITIDWIDHYGFALVTQLDKEGNWIFYPTRMMIRIGDTPTTIIQKAKELAAR